MKIISKYKDYYDFLVGVYGEDPLLVLDRRDFQLPDFNRVSPFNTPTCKKVDLYIAGKNIQGLYYDGKFYYGEDIGQFGYQHKYRGYYNRNNGIEYYHIDPRFSGEGHHNRIDILKTITPSNINIKFNCPILLSNSRNVVPSEGQYYKFPILGDLGLASFLSPEEIWLMLVDYLSKKEDIPDKRTNKEKILNAGFDLKESFRGTQKKPII